MAARQTRSKAPKSGVMVGSSVSMLKNMFADENEAALKATKKTAFSSVPMRFVNNLNSLLGELQACAPTHSPHRKPLP